jgi:hypothetical protein
LKFFGTSFTKRMIDITKTPKIIGEVQNHTFLLFITY